MKVAFAVTGVILTVCLAIAGLQDTNQEWKSLQAEFKTVALNMSSDEKMKEAVLRMEDGIQQDFLPGLNRIDRCRTCHLGVQNPNMENAEQPHTKHPGNLLDIHPTERFGCTICHQGQGLATTTADAHARDIKFWEEPMLSSDFVEASCEKCHKGVEVEGASVLNDGRRIAKRKGCAGCHKYYGKGGMVGPELTGLGKASIYLKHPVEENLDKYREQASGDLNIAYIMEAIKEPKVQPEKTTMPEYKFSAWEIRALTTYIKSLNNEDVPSEYIPKKAYAGPEPDGQDLFEQYCSACHGLYGRGGLEVGRMGISLNNERFLSLASPEFLRGVISTGRNSKNKIMPAWSSEGGRLETDEIEKILTHILSWKNSAPSFNSVMEAEGSLDMGMGLYRRNCADCHGSHREGKIGPSLFAPEFLYVASSRFIYETIGKGRPGTAMPGWNWLKADQIKSLLTFLQTPEKQNTSIKSVSRNGNPSLGKKIYQGRCRTCHGRKGQGDIGPSLNSPEFATLAQDDFIIKTILKGRMDSGMPAWEQLPADDLSDVTAFVRSLGKPIKMGQIPFGKGNAVDGKEVFVSICSKCHGMEGEGGTGPAIGAPDFLNTATDNFLLGTIKYGRSNTEMRPMGDVPGTLVNLTDRQIKDVVSYLRASKFIYNGHQTIRGSIGAGEEWYGRVCLKCHGAKGMGGIGPALSNPAFLTAASDGFLQATMALGRSGTEMRPVTRQAGGIVEFNRATINDIIAFIRYQKEIYGKTKENVQTAFGSIQNGSAWFDRICSKCHGNKGKGTDAAPGLNDMNFLGYASDGYLQGTITLGRTGTPMRAFGLHGDGIAGLTARQITNITTHIRSWSKPLLYGAINKDINQK